MLLFARAHEAQFLVRVDGTKVKIDAAQTNLSDNGRSLVLVNYIIDEEAAPPTNRGQPKPVSGSSWRKASYSADPRPL